MPLFGSNIRKMREKGDIEGLANALKDDNPGTRVEASEALMDCTDPKAMEVLLKEFRDTFKFGDEADKAETITIMRAHPTRESLGAVGHSLDWSEDRFRRMWKYEKTKFSKKLNLDIARPILMDAFTNVKENPFIRWYAVTSLVELGDRSEEVLEALPDTLRAMSAINVWIIEESVRALSYFAGNPSVIDWLVKIQKGEVFETELDAIPKVTAIYALGAIGGSQSGEYLEYLASHGDKFYQNRAKLALRLLGKANYDEIKAAAEKEIID
jgi:HEAT repeat protein